MSFVVIIPARFASTRLPGKPLQDINGKPMIVHVLELSLIHIFSAAFLCTIEHLAQDVTRKLVIKSNWKVSTFRTLSPGKNYVTAPIFMKGELHDVQPA